MSKYNLKQIIDQAFNSGRYPVSVLRPSESDVIGFLIPESFDQASAQLLASKKKALAASLEKRQRACSYFSRGFEHKYPSGDYDMYLTTTTNEGDPNGYSAKRDADTIDFMDTVLLEARDVAVTELLRLGGMDIQGKISDDVLGEAFTEFLSECGFDMKFGWNRWNPQTRTYSFEETDDVHDDPVAWMPGAMINIPFRYTFDYDPEVGNMIDWDGGFLGADWDLTESRKYAKELTYFNMFVAYIVASAMTGADGAAPVLSETMRLYGELTGLDETIDSTVKDWAYDDAQEQFDRRPDCPDW